MIVYVDSAQFNMGTSWLVANIQNFGETISNHKKYIFSSFRTIELPEQGIGNDIICD